MGQIEWAMWANEQAILSAYAVFIGGVIGVAGQFKYWQCAASAIPISLFILLMEWPRSKRVRGTTIERQFQPYLVPVHAKLGPVTRNYYVRFVLYLLLSIPSCFLLPTLMGAMCQMIAGIIYLVAAIKKEEWKPTAVKKSDNGTTGPKLNITEPPSRPPPRAPVKRQSAGVQNEAIEHENIELTVPV